MSFGTFWHSGSDMSADESLRGASYSTIAGFLVGKDLSQPAVVVKKKCSVFKY